jgi:serine protease Do
LLKIVRGILKALAIVGGAFITVVGLMSVVGLYTDNGWARMGAAIVVALAVPLFLVERVLAKLHSKKVDGVATDVLAVVYAAFALGFVGVAHAYTAPLLRDEGQRLAASGFERIAWSSYMLAGGRGVATKRISETIEDKPKVVAAVEPKPEPKPEAKVPAKEPELVSGDGKERTPAQIFAEYAPAVVTVTVKSPMGEGGGTGFILDGSGTIATAYHVIDHASEIKIKLMDGTIAEAVEILVENQPNDLALLRIKTAKLPAPIVLGDSDKIAVGERAVSIGNPLGLEHTLTDGVISSRRMMEGRKMIQMSTPVSPGNSGGPLFNSKGEVVGVSTAIFMGGSPLAQNLNLATPINDLRAMLRTDYPGHHKAGEETSRGGNW